MLLIALVLIAAGTAVWVALTGEVTPLNIGTGVVVSTGLLLLNRGIVLGGSDRDEGGQHSAVTHFDTPREIVVNGWRLVTFTVYLIWEIIVANFSVARIVLFPRLFPLRPGIVAIPLDIRSDVGITLLAHAITLTPGTLSMEVSSDRKTLYVHVMSMENEAHFREQIKEGFEKRLKVIFDD